MGPSSFQMSKGIPIQEKLQRRKSLPNSYPWNAAVCVLPESPQTLGLPTSPDAKDLLMRQMREFSQVASAYYQNNNILSGS